MSPSPHGAVAPTLANYTELVHRAFADQPGCTIVFIDPGADDVAIGAWPVPSDVETPADPLVGFLAPTDWFALGLVAGGRRWSPGSVPAGAPSAVGCTVLFDRDGRSASILASSDRPDEVITDVPAGWVPDLLLRAFGRPTPPPETGIAEFIERTWLDRVARVALDQPGRIRHWRAVGRLHPLAPPGPVPPGVILAVHSQALEAESSWSRMRRMWGETTPNNLPNQLPGGRLIGLADWFDDGSYSRWVARNLPETDQLLPPILDALPGPVGAELLDALSSVT